MAKMNVGRTFLHFVWVAFLLVSTLIQPGDSDEDCLSPLGMEDRRIKDDQLRPTTVLNGLSLAANGRLNHKDGYGGWCPNQTRSGNETGPFYNQFIQVKLDVPVRLKGIATQGRYNGLEKVERYWIAYTPDIKNVNLKWIKDEKTRNVKFFEGNGNSKLHTSILKPPIVVEVIRIVPELLRGKQVCLRFELLGCPLKYDLVTYRMPQGNTRGGVYNFTDSSYDGFTKDHFLSAGLGILTDGKLGPEDYVDTTGLGWIGWNAKDTSTPYIIFEFLNTRIFHSMTLHCNVRDRTKIKLFSKVVVSFNVDGVSYDASLTHKSRIVSSGSSWMNYNVTIDLCQHIGKLMKLNFTYAGHWILISEVIFDSEPLGSKSPPQLFCASPLPPLLSTMPPTDTGSLVTSSSPSEGVLGGEDPGASSGSGSMDGGVIAGIICAVIAVLLAIALIICWKRYPHLLFQREKPFNSFIKVEVKPYAHYHAPQRVSRLESTVSESEEKRYSFKNTICSEGGVGGADVTVCPIYASIQENLNKSGSADGNLNNLSKCQRHNSEQKPPRKVKPSIPPPLKPFQQTPDNVYAEPNIPLLSPTSPGQGGSPKPPIPPRASQINFTNASNFPDNHYAEPDSPSEKSPMIEEPPQSAKPRIVSGYAEPIDAISPTSTTTFPNPIYEEVYSEPYQGVSGTSLYCNPDEDLNFRPRLDTFKDFPRHKLHFREKIGDGQFGEVHIGEAEGLGDILGEEFKHSPLVTVAIKTLKLDVDKNIKDDFFKEVKVMAGLRHSNVVRLLGVCRDDPMCMIVEYMANGDLNQFLKEKELTPSLSLNESDGWEDAGQYVSPQALFYMAKQVAAGMKYISSLNYVHRDLATRNCLVGHAYTVKIADFGMSRNLYCKHYYRIEGRVILPIRWMAPECILQGRFTTASDVWAYGVTLWEILTLAKEYPYSELTDEEVIQNVQKMFHGQDKPVAILPQPETCPDDLYELMKQCWAKEPEERPAFMELHSNIAERVRLSEVTI